MEGILENKNYYLKFEDFEKCNYTTYLNFNNLNN